MSLYYNKIIDKIIISIFLIGGKLFESNTRTNAVYKYNNKACTLDKET